MRITKTLLTVLLLSVMAFAQTAPPTDLTATVGTSGPGTLKSVSLAWVYGQTTTNVKYNVYKKSAALADTTHHFNKISSTSQKTYVDRTVQTGHTYSYYVTAGYRKC